MHASRPQDDLALIDAIYEAKVAQALMEGLTIEDTAQRLGIAATTTRTHMKRIFSKTGTSRQAELVLLLLGTTPYLDPR